jgi:hypothetical protein
VTDITHGAIRFPWLRRSEKAMARERSVISEGKAGGFSPLGFEVIPESNSPDINIVLDIELRPL